MAARDTIQEFLDREPFEPFRVLTTGGESFTIRNPRLVVAMKSELFIARPDSDRRSYVPFLHVAAVETLDNGQRRNGLSRRRKGRK